ncbi:hypothetical protein EAF04_008942 [Stromatinia cepivora]|nr:hypothetical protein EAF04_008942 [Stromatinia cepivora]
MKDDVSTIASDEDKLNLKAKEMIGLHVRVDPIKTTGDGEWVWKTWPEVVGVVVYRNSNKGNVRVIGGEEEDNEFEATGPEYDGASLIVVKKDQTCLLYKYPSVRFIRGTPEFTAT